MPIVVPTPLPPTLLSARQIRQVDPSQDGVVRFTDGSALIFGVTTPAPGITFIPTASGNVVPQVGDWVLTTRPAINTQSPTENPGTQNLSTQFQNPQPAGVGPFVYVPQAQFNAAYIEQYGQGQAPRQGEVA